MPKLQRSREEGENAIRVTALKVPNREKRTQDLIHTCKQVMIALGRELYRGDHPRDDAVIVRDIIHYLREVSSALSRAILDERKLKRCSPKS